MFDHASSPGIGAGVPYRTRDTLELGELEDPSIQRQTERIECYRLSPLKVAVAVAKAPDLRAVGQGLHAEQRRRHRLQSARELECAFVCQQPDINRAVVIMQTRRIDDFAAPSHRLYLSAQGGCQH